MKSQKVKGKSSAFYIALSHPYYRIETALTSKAKRNSSQLCSAKIIYSERMQLRMATLPVYFSGSRCEASKACSNGIYLYLF